MVFANGHALIIGVGIHSNAPYLNAPQTVADAREVEKILLDEQYCGYLKEHVHLLSEDKASKSDILNSLDQLAERSTPEDTVTIFYSGHGDLGTDSEYYLVSHDAQIAETRVVKGSGVSISELVAKVNTIRANKVLLLFNACRSGEITRKLDSTQALGDKPLSNAAADALLGTGEGRVVISACRPEQSSYFLSKSHLTFFGQALVDALCGKELLPRGGFISVFDLYLAVYESVRQVAAQNKVEQDPVLTIRENVGAFAVALYTGAHETDLTALKAQTAPPQGPAVRQISAERSQRFYQQIMHSTIHGNVIGVVEGNVIDASHSKGTIIKPSGSVTQIWNEDERDDAKS